MFWLIAAIWIHLTADVSAQTPFQEPGMGRETAVMPASRTIHEEKSFRSNFTLGSQNVDDSLFRGYVEEIFPRLQGFEKQIQCPKYDDAKDITVLREYVGKKIKEVQQLIKSSESWKQKYSELKEAASQAVEFLTRREGISKKAGMALKKAEWPQ